MKPKTGKRIVSKGEYVKARVTQVSMSLFTGPVYILIFISILVTVASALSFFIALLAILLGSEGAFGSCLRSLIVCLLSYALVCGGTKFADKMMEVSDEIDPGIPFTRANTADLPAPDSLVRASSEPLQAQEDVLLRAVAQGQETPSEQLVRASAGVE